ncbi:MAG: molybdopterin synthase sulfur carrier subunit [Proteobacteria bacterium]|nr:MAG: molybdopterin synthase sulfur carrier subunit [Pseudomonadota bacterium]
MKSIKVLYFASLRESLAKAEDTIEFEEALDAGGIWQRLNPDRAIPEACLVAINQEYADLQTCVKAGDEVAFFPPVTGG